MHEASVPADRSKLSLDQLDVSPTLLDQLVVRPTLLDPPILEHKDPVCVPDGRESVSDGEGRPADRGTVDRALDEGLGLVVEGLEKWMRDKRSAKGWRGRGRRIVDTYGGRFVELEEE